MPRHGLRHATAIAAIVPSVRLAIVDNSAIWKLVQAAVSHLGLLAISRYQRSDQSSGGKTSSGESLKEATTTTAIGAIRNTNSA